MSARILVSRNKREGGYLGWRVLGPMKRARSWYGRKPGHQRKGGELMVSTLREHAKAGKKNPRGNVFVYFEDKLIGTTSFVSLRLTGGQP
jgi:hypothetical protein